MQVAVSVVNKYVHALRKATDRYKIYLDYEALSLRCFDTVCQRPYRYFLIAYKVVFSLSDCYEIFTNNWLWIEICNVVLSKINITNDNNKQKTLKLIKAEFCAT